MIVQLSFREEREMREATRLRPGRLQRRLFMKLLQESGSPRQYKVKHGKTKRDARFQILDINARLCFA
jgi:hypothetical protein